MAPSLAKNYKYVPEILMNNLSFTNQKIEMQEQKNNFKVIADRKNARMLLPNMLTLFGVCIGLTSITNAESRVITHRPQSALFNADQDPAG